MGFLPLAVLRLVLGFLTGISVGGRPVPGVGRWGGVTGLGWSGRGGGRAGCGVEQAGPFLLAVPAVGQVDGEVAVAVAGGPCGDIDEVAAQCGAAGLGVGQARQRSGGPQQVAADRGERQPGGVRGERAGGKVREGPSDQSAKTCSAWAWPPWCSSA